MEIVNYSFTSSYAKITVLPFTVDSLTDAVSAVLSISISSPRVPSLLRAYSFQPSIGLFCQKRCCAVVAQDCHIGVVKAHIGVFYVA